MPAKSAKNIEITINLENAAFEMAGIELARILRKEADKLEEQIDLEEGNDWQLHDINGNAVGSVDLS